jgi:hypothetical protein
MSFSGLAFMAGWAAALGALVYAVVTLVRVWPHEWMRSHGHPAVRLLVPTPTYRRLTGAGPGYRVFSRNVPECLCDVARSRL